MNYLQEYKELIQLRNLSDATLRNYLSVFKCVCKALSKEIQDVTEHDLRKYLLSKKEFSSSSKMNTINAFKSFYSLVLHREFDHKILPRPKVEQRQPDILSVDEVKMMLSKISNIKHKAVVALMYSCALRVGEVVNLKIADIDSKTNRIVIKNGKGKVDRIVMLDKNLLKMIREYYSFYSTKTYLFEGNKGDKYSAKSIQTIVKKAALSCGIKKNISSHSMRHSCLTQLVKDGVDLRSVQKLAGHKNINTTANYVKIIDSDILSIKSPLSKIFQ